MGGGGRGVVRHVWGPPPVLQLWRIPRASSLYCAEVKQIVLVKFPPEKSLQEIKQWKKEKKKRKDVQNIWKANLLTQDKLFLIKYYSFMFLTENIHFDF